MIDENDDPNANQDVLDEEASGDEGASPDLDRLSELGFTALHLHLTETHRVGVALGQGRTITELLALPHQTAEGVKSCRSVVELAARNGVDMPICQGVTAVVDGAVTPEQLTGALMSRARKHELA